MEKILYFIIWILVFPFNLVSIFDDKWELRWKLYKKFYTKHIGGKK